jgi:4-amino-4-deoxy-L-arabinose transferase-like glycosyltransferase
MQSSLFDRWSAFFSGVVDGLCDPQRRRRVMLAIAAAYGTAWLVYGVVAKSSQDLNGDLAEMVAWGHESALGYPKHPPLLAYAVKLWFAIFPQTDWAFLLLTALTLSAGIYLAFELCGLWIDGEKRAAVPFLLGAIPFYNFLGLKFDQNSVLIPLWALAMLALMRSIETRRAGWAALTGLAASAAMLTKYWSALLLIALAAAALADTRRAIYFRSKAPWITAFVFIVVGVPHAIWLVDHNFPPFRWAEQRISNSDIDVLRSLSEFIFGTMGYAAAALALVAIFIHPSGKAVRDSWFAMGPARRSATLLFWTPLVLPIALALVKHINLLSIWNEPSLNLLPVMMLASPLVVVSRAMVARIAAVVTAFTLIVVAASPLVALIHLKQGVENDAAYAKLAAAATEGLWREGSNAPLRLIAGPFALANSAAFYAADRPSTYSNFSDYLSPWVTAQRIDDEGIAIICPVDDQSCLNDMNALAKAKPESRRTEVTLVRHWLGFAGEPKRFVIATIPPRAAL